MKKVNCYNCDSDESIFYAKENGFSLVKCAICGLLYVNNRPEDDEISEANRQGVHSGEKILNVKGRFSQSRVYQSEKVLADLYKDGLSRIKTWLDIGCGHGEFMLALKKFSKDKICIKGTDPIEYKQENARRKGLNVSFFELNSHNEKYDAISLLNVFSHLTNPPDFLDSIKKLLNPNGELLLQTGDTANLIAEKHFRPFNLPDHLSFASEKIVVDILKRKGFEIIQIKKYPFIIFNLKNLLKEIAKVFIPKYKTRIRYLLKINKFPKTDMYIRAVLKN